MVEPITLERSLQMKVSDYSNFTIKEINQKINDLKMLNKAKNDNVIKELELALIEKGTISVDFSIVLRSTQDLLVELRYLEPFYNEEPKKYEAEYLAIKQELMIRAVCPSSLGNLITVHN